jgi:hypothetical protein
LDGAFLEIGEWPPEDVSIGDVIQLDPDLNETFGACFATVTELKPWGVQAYVMVPQKGGADPAYVRVRHGGFVRIAGRPEWALGELPY